MTDPSAGAPHRRLFWAATVLALAVTAVGIALAVHGPARPSGPAAVVLRYFAALQRGDAATALSFGRRPAADDRLLTAPVLRDQQRVAPITGVAVASVHRDGDRARVQVSYALDYPDGSTPQRAVLRLRRSHGAWRLLRAAGTTRLVVAPASQRATVLGAAVPDHVVALFPGAAPIGFDTPYLEVSNRSDPVGLRTGAVTVVRPAVDRAGRFAVSVRLQRMLGNCLSSGGVACPLPPGRVVPGSVRGRRVGALTAVRVRLARSPLGIVSVRARAAVSARYRALDFRDVPIARQRRVTLLLHTSGYVMAPLRLSWRA